MRQAWLNKLNKLRQDPEYIERQNRIKEIFDQTRKPYKWDKAVSSYENMYLSQKLRHPEKSHEELITIVDSQVSSLLPINISKEILSRGVNLDTLKESLREKLNESLLTNDDLSDYENEIKNKVRAENPELQGAALDKKIEEYIKTLPKLTDEDIAENEESEYVDINELSNTMNEKKRKLGEGIGRITAKLKVGGPRIKKPSTLKLFKKKSRAKNVSQKGGTRKKKPRKPRKHTRSRRRNRRLAGTHRDRKPPGLANISLGKYYDEYSQSFKEVPGINTSKRFQSKRNDIMLTFERDKLMRRLNRIIEEMPKQSEAQRENSQITLQRLALEVSSLDEKIKANS